MEIRKNIRKKYKKKCELLKEWENILVRKMVETSKKDVIE